MIAATALFVAGHFVLSSKPLRGPLRRVLGARLFLAAYSIVAIAAFAWMMAAYGAAPYLEVWTPPPYSRAIPLALMPLSCILVIGGLTTPSLTAVGGEQAEGVGGPGSAAPGMISITRHPALWGFSLWAAAHLAVRGDAANMILMAGILVLSIGGMIHIDLRREDALGSAWGPTVMTTSVLPFAAILSGRTKLDWKGIGWPRLLGGLVLYGVLILAHPWIAGVALISG